MGISDETGDGVVGRGRRAGGGEARLLMGRVGVRVDILPALCHRRDASGGRVRGRVRESTGTGVGTGGEVGAGVGTAGGLELPGVGAAVPSVGGRVRARGHD